MDSCKPLTAAEIEEIKALVGNHYTTWESDDKEAAATYLARLLSMLTPPPDAAVREAVETIQSWSLDAEDEAWLLGVLRAVQAPRLNQVQVEVIRSAYRMLRYHGDYATTPNAVRDTLSSMVALFPQVFDVEVPND